MSPSLATLEKSVTAIYHCGFIQSRFAFDQRAVLGIIDPDQSAGRPRLAIVEESPGSTGQDDG